MSAPRKRPGTQKAKGSSDKFGPFAREAKPKHDDIPESHGPQDDEYVDLLKEVTEATEREMLYVPPPISWQPPELPEDWSTISVAQLQKLYGEFSAFALRADHLHNLEAAKAKVCSDAANELFNALFSVATVNKDSSVTHVKSQIENDPHVKRWRKRQQKHEAFAEVHKRDGKMYADTCERLSRLHTMQQDEFERAGGKTPRAK